MIDDRVYGVGLVQVVGAKTPENFALRCLESGIPGRAGPRTWLDDQANTFRMVVLVTLERLKSSVCRLAVDEDLLDLLVGLTEHAFYALVEKTDRVQRRSDYTHERTG